MVGASSTRSEGLRGKERTRHEDERSARARTDSGAGGRGSVEAVISRSARPHPPMAGAVISGSPAEGRRAQRMKHRCPDRAGRLAGGAKEGREVRMS